MNSREQASLQPRSEWEIILSQMLFGVTWPLRDREDLINKTRGKNRKIKLRDHNGKKRLYHVLDVLDAIPNLDGCFPLESLSALLKHVQRYEIRKQARGKRSALSMIGSAHLRKSLRVELNLEKYPDPPSSQDESDQPSFMGSTNRDAEQSPKVVLWDGPVPFTKPQLEYLGRLLYTWETPLVTMERAVHRAERDKNTAESEKSQAERHWNDIVALLPDPFGPVAADILDEIKDLAHRICRDAQQAEEAARLANLAAQNCLFNIELILSDTPGDAGQYSSEDEETAEDTRDSVRSHAEDASAASEQARKVCERANRLVQILELFDECPLVRICGEVYIGGYGAEGGTVEVYNLDHPLDPVHAHAQATPAGWFGWYEVYGPFGGCGVYLHYERELADGVMATYDECFDVPLDPQDGEVRKDLHAERP